MKEIVTVFDFKERVNDAINNFAAINLNLLTSSYEEVMQRIKGEKMFVPFEKGLAKKNYVLSSEIRQSQQEVITQYDGFIGRALNAKNIEELKQITREALKYLKEVSK